MKKKIIILMLHLQYGGIEKQTTTFANELSKKYDVEIISVYSMNREPAYEINRKIKIKYLIDDAPNRNEFKNAIKNKNILTVFKEGIKAIKILFLKNYLMIKEIKRLNCDFVFSTRIEYANMLSKYCKKGITKITEEHLHDDSKKYINRIKKSFKNLDYLITIGKGSTENYSKWLTQNKKIKIVEIPNIIENIPNESSSLEENNIISVGRLHKVKDFETLIKVFNLVQKEITNTTLTIVGGGEEYDNLNSLINKLNLNNKIKITGMVGKDEVSKYLLSSDVYVMTSLTECFPMVLLEASSAGLPLVAFNVPVGPKAIIRNGENGYLIENRDIEDMANKVIELLNNREELKRIGKNSKENSYKYLPENVMKKWYEIFDK